MGAFRQTAAPSHWPIAPALRLGSARQRRHGWESLAGKQRKIGLTRPHPAVADAVTVKPADWPRSSHEAWRCRITTGADTRSVYRDSAPRSPPAVAAEALRCRMEEPHFREDAASRAWTATSKSSPPACLVKTTMGSYGGLRSVDMCSRAQLSRVSRSRRLRAHETDLDNHRPGYLLLCYDQRTIPRTSTSWSLRHGDILRDV